MAAGAVSGRASNARVPQPGDAGYEPDEPLIDFCQEVHPRLLDALYVWTGDRELTIELADETLVQMWLAWPQSNGPISRTAWCFRAAHQIVTSRRRRFWPLRRSRSPEVVYLGYDREIEALDPATLQVVAALPARERDVIALQYGGRLSVRDTAAVLGVSEEVVRGAMRRAVAALYG